MRLIIGGILMFLMLPTGIFGQGLFETAEAEVSGTALPVGINGYARGVLYTGEYAAPVNSEIRSAYGEAALKLNAHSGSRARFYADIRFRSGYEYGEWIKELIVNEAYVDLYLGPFELRAGHAVLTWGRADVMNPTNNLTPRDYFVRSPEISDRYDANFLLRGRLNLGSSLRLETVWVPRYRYSVYRFDLFEMPSYVSFSESPLPDAALRNGTIAAKLDFLFEGFDGSLSWFNGYDPMPGIHGGEIPRSPAEDLTIQLYSRAFRQQTLGLDFSLGLGFFGVRGEAALRDPMPEYREETFAPNRDLRYILEVERSFGNFSLMALYYGQYVFDFDEGAVPGSFPEIDPSTLQDPATLAMLGPMMEQQVAAFNRVIFDQNYELAHSVGLRPALSLFHDVVSIEVFGLFNITSEEWGVLPRLTWHVSDNLKLTAGAEYYEGPENTRMNLVAPVFNGGYFELRYSF